MNSLRRWARFNAVGLMGAVVQLSALALLNHVLPKHYLYTSSLAVELTLLHNFFWHIHYTWRDRCYTSSRLGQGLRFQLSNGSVSLFGNLAVMHLLVGSAHLPPLPANLLAILCCSAVNFVVGDHWVFG